MWHLVAYLRERITCMPHKRHQFYKEKVHTKMFCRRYESNWKIPTFAINIARNSEIWKDNSFPLIYLNYFPRYFKEWITRKNVRALKSKNNIWRKVKTLKWWNSTEEFYGKFVIQAKVWLLLWCNKISQYAKFINFSEIEKIFEF